MQGSANLNLMIKAARKAGRSLVKDFREVENLQVSAKGPGDFVTRADREAERIIKEELRGARPSYGWLGEETGEEAGEDPTRRWIVDPLDGTTNYARGLPGFSVSIAAARDGIVQCGVVYDPLLDLVFGAQRGQGAYCNGERLHVSQTADVGSSLVLLDWPRDPAPREAMADLLSRVVPVVDAVRSRGSAAFGMCAVAAGWADAYFQLTLQPWDVAAGWLIVEEAGGRVTDLAGASSALSCGDWLVTNGLVHTAFLPYTQAARAAGVAEPMRP